MGANAAKETKACLDEERRLDKALGQEVVQIVQMARIVALKLVTRAGRVQCFKGITNILEAVSEDQVMRTFKHGRLPVVLEFLVALQHRKEPEIHRSHVQGGDFRLPFGRGTNA